MIVVDVMTADWFCFYSVFDVKADKTHGKHITVSETHLFLCLRNLVK
jgi:hypothetical protein